MRIGFIGYGSMTEALASRWVGSHDVFIGGRNVEKAAELASRLGPDVGSGTSAEAVAAGDLVVLATPASAVGDAIDGAGGADAFGGKVVIDINNPVSVPGGPHQTEGTPYIPHTFPEGSLAEHIQALVPNAHVVKAFNMCQATVWTMDPPVFDGRRLVTLYCGNDDEAKASVARLIEALGSEAVDAGTLEYARLLESAAGLVIKFLFAGRDMRTVLNLIQPEVKDIG